MQNNLSEQIPINDLDPVDFDKIVRDMLANWGKWQRDLPEAAPSPVPGKQPQFREVLSDPSAEDEKKEPESIPRTDEAEYTESIVCRMSPHDRSVLVRYFIRTQNTVVCAERMHMSRRKFEMWLNTAVGKFAGRVEDDDVGMSFVFELLLKRNRK